MNWNRSLIALAGFTCLGLSGCRLDAGKHGEGDNVKIATPFGGMQIKTNGQAVQTGIGLPDYPGATLIKDGKKDKDNGAADINMSFGSFQLRVKAVSYRTSDSPEKVQAFYRNALGRFGDVIECADNRPVGKPTHTAEGLTCDNEKGNHISVSDEVSSKFELKAGSPQHQHIVAIDREENDTKFGLVALDLPGHLSVGDKQDSSQ